MMMNNNLLWYLASPPTVRSITVEPEYADFTPTTISQSVEVTASHSWVVDSKPYWISAIPNNGTSGTGYINLTVYPEPPDAEIGIVTLKLVGYPDVTANVYVSWIPDD